MNPTTPLYSLHERVWHWLQALAIVALIVTGFQLHFPDRLAIVGSMSRAVTWHSWLGLALVANAFLGLFYHVTAEKYRHFLPTMDDFSSGAIRQFHYYFFGIFKGEPHPFDTDPERKLNPLQKLTYLAMLNVLLPFQLASGLLLWGAARWPTLFDRMGGLGALGPAHTLGAYFFVAFLVVHLYLTTTGKTPVSLIRAMVTGSESPSGPGSGDFVTANRDDFENVCALDGPGVEVGHGGARIESCEETIDEHDKA